MRPGQVCKVFCAVIVSVTCAGGISGCETNTEIPLAKVAPPPEGFSQTKSKVNIPSNASPANANERRR
jgi:hypothetical protein